MSTALSTYEVEEARRLAVLTDADKAVIAAEARRTAFSFDTESDIKNKIGKEIRNAAWGLERATDLGDWSASALELLTGNSYSTAGVRSLADFVAKVEATLVERESEADDEYPVDTSLHADVRKWLAVSPHTVYRFREYVLEAAADAARDSALEMLGRGSREDSSVPRAVEEASTKWVKAWEKKGEIL